MAQVEVPIPPSANTIWRQAGRGRVVRSKAYAAWAAAAVLLLRAGLPKVEVPARVRVTVVGGRGWAAGRDLDNVLKPVIDAVRHAGRIPDDDTGWVRRVEAEFVTGPAGEVARCYVSLSPLEE